MGSKNSIAADIVKFLPEADNFYDLFAGGCAVTHAAMLSGKYKNVYANDLDSRPVTLFRCESRKNKPCEFCDATGKLKAHITIDFFPDHD